MLAKISNFVFVPKISFKFREDKGTNFQLMCTHVLNTYQTLKEIMPFKFHRRIIQSNIERVDTLKTFHSPHRKNRIFVGTPDLQKRKTLTHEEMKTQQEVARSKLHKENISKFFPKPK